VKISLKLTSLTKIRVRGSKPLVEFFILVGPFSYLCLPLKIHPSDYYYLLSPALVFLSLLPKLFSSPLCSAPNVCDEQILGKVFLLFYLDLARKFLPLASSLRHPAPHAPCLFGYPHRIRIAHTTPKIYFQ
jgi:hypothetical protein